jgi:predicted secreted protein
LNITTKIMTAWALTAAAIGASAQTMGPASVQNVVQLSASASLEVAQDWLTLSMNTTRDGPDASAVQAQLKTALAAALSEAQKAAKPGEMDVRSGNFSLSPRYGRDGKITGWQGSVELVLEGQDIQRISMTAGKIQTLTMGSVSFGLSRAQRVKVEGEVQALAIERFRSKAGDIAKSFGFGGYSLREVSVNANEPSPMPRPRMQAMELKTSAMDAPVPVEAGKSSVIVTVAGSVQLK